MIIFSIVVVILLILFIKMLLSRLIKTALILLFIVVVGFSIAIFVNPPQMHKPFSFNIIEYLVKFNDDGSMTTSKQVTTTKIQEQGK